MRRALAIALLSAMPVQAAGAEIVAADLCDFLNKVAAASADEFWPLTDAPRNANADGNPLSSNLAPAANIRCAVIPRHREDAQTRPPQYSCELIGFGVFRSAASLAGPERVFDTTETRLRACFRQGTFVQHTEGDRARGTYRKNLTLQQPGYNLELLLSVVPVFENEPALIAVQLVATGTTQAQ